MPLLELRAVTRTVRLPDLSELHILRGVDLAVEAGEHVADVGRLGGRRRARRRGEDFGFVFQQFNLLPGRTALENVVAPLLYARGRAFWRRRHTAQEMLDRVGLAGRMDSLPAQLSGGEQQRVAIARALVRSPRVILADEPTGALDVDTGREVIDLLDGIAADTGAALIAITHDLAVASRARRHLRLGDGVLTPIEIAPRSGGTLESLVGSDVVVPAMGGAGRAAGAEVVS